MVHEKNGVYGNAWILCCATVERCQQMGIHRDHKDRDGRQKWTHTDRFPDRLLLASQVLTDGFVWEGDFNRHSLINTTTRVCFWSNTVVDLISGQSA